MDYRDVALREALHRHLTESGFPPDLGDPQRWVTLRFGPIPLCLPNLPIRQKAMLPHDLNHVVSGYGHDLVGESEVGAWEIGGGCGRFLAAWVLAWSIIAPGVVVSPKRIVDAFVRGRHTGNLFTCDLDPILEQPVAQVQARLGLDRCYDPNTRDRVSFIVVVLLAPLVGAVPRLVSLVTSPWWLAQRAYHYRRPALPK
jgi:hypothetical protein